jgi:hypothetical protein
VNTLRDGILNRQFRVGTLESQQVLRLKNEGKKKIKVVFAWIHFSQLEVGIITRQPGLRASSDQAQIFWRGSNTRPSAQRSKAGLLSLKKKPTRMQNCKGNSEACNASIQEI